MERMSDTKIALEVNRIKGGFTKAIDSVIADIIRNSDTKHKFYNASSRTSGKDYVVILLDNKFEVDHLILKARSIMRKNDPYFISSKKYHKAKRKAFNYKHKTKGR